MSILFFDTETTGLKKDNLPAVHEDQPMPVQLGLKLDDDKGEEVCAMNTLIQTNGRIIQPGASAVHGIDKDKADRYGIHLVTAVEAFLDYVAAADIIVAHNIAFDSVVMQRATYVYSQQTNTPFRNPFEGKLVVCTMEAATDIVKATPKRYGKWKWPRLEECMKFFFNEKLDGAHDALVDVRACSKVYYQLIKDGVINV